MRRMCRSISDLDHLVATKFAAVASIVHSGVHILTIQQDDLVAGLHISCVNYPMFEGLKYHPSVLLEEAGTTIPRQLDIRYQSNTWNSRNS